MHRLARRAEDQQQKLAPDQLNMAPLTRTEGELAAKGPRADNTMDEQFPTASLTAKDERDKIMEAKLQLQDPDRPGYTQFGKLEARDEDFKWLQKKKDAVEAANFQQWFAVNFDHMSPADKKRAKELYPEFYKQRKRLLKQQTKNLMRLAKLKLEGVEDFDDLQVQYLAETGRLDVGPLKHLLNPEQVPGMNAASEQGRFQRGLLSPFRVFGEEAYVQRGSTGVGEREIQAQDFAQRVYGTEGVDLGVGTGFPPMTNARRLYPSEQSDKFWFQQLRMQ